MTCECTCWSKSLIQKQMNNPYTVSWSPLRTVVWCHNHVPRPRRFYSLGELKNKLFLELIPLPPSNVPRRAHREAVAVSWLPDFCFPVLPSSDLQSCQSLATGKQEGQNFLLWMPKGPAYFSVSRLLRRGHTFLSDPITSQISHYEATAQPAQK